jgi:tight adherence protein B
MKSGIRKPKSLCIENAKTSVSQLHWLAYIGAGYLFFFAIGQIFYGNLVFSVVSGFLIFLTLDRYKKYLLKKKQRILRNQFGDLLYSFAASFATGRQLSSALQDAYVNLGYLYKPDSPMMLELKHMNRSFEDGKVGEETILLEFAERCGLDDIRNFVDVYLCCRAAGGDINQVVENASEILMAKMSIERDIKVMTSQKQFEGKIISSIPVLVILALNISTPGYLDNLYSTLHGRLIMTAALAGIATAYILTGKITAIDG